MPTNTNRIMLTLPADVEEELARLKETACPGQSDAELYRDILRLGIEKWNETRKVSEQK